jgi:hypothetical protein
MSPMNLLDLEIYAWIARYLNGSANLDEFEDWFVPATWEVERSGNLPAVDVANPVRAALAELSADAMDESEFRALLASLEAQRTDRMRIFQTFVAAHEQPLSETREVDFTVTTPA